MHGSGGGTDVPAVDMSANETSSSVADESSDIVAIVKAYLSGCARHVKVLGMHLRKSDNHARRLWQSLMNFSKRQLAQVGLSVPTKLLSVVYIIFIIVVFGALSSRAIRSRVYSLLFKPRRKAIL